MLNQWGALCYYCDDGPAEPDNNAAERALRTVCLGKKNYIFFGSDHGGERGALLYGLSATCRLNGIAPETCLRHILSVLPEWPPKKWLNSCHGTWISPINSSQYGAHLTTAQKR
ncbi:IS66 family transposase [Citrobacter sp. NCU1]|uniref:IS66 family transposase n=1 Tax=Citrobacter sp. NCU1 TaxID=2026683 RepID=UPI00406CE088